MSSHEQPPGGTLPASEGTAPPGSGVPSLRVVVVQTPDDTCLGRVLPLLGGALTVGREAAEPGLCVFDRSLSRVHARLAWDSRMARVRVTDAGSRNGTFVNGQRADSALLGHGDVVRFGDTLLVCEERSPMDELLAELPRLAADPGPLLVLGESGAGKEWFARELQRRRDASAPFVVVQCDTLTSVNAAQALLGECTSPQPGLVRSAEGGTLFVDEICEAPHVAQLALLRLIDHARVSPVGAGIDLPVRTRVVAASSIEPRSAVAQGAFMRDLAQRLGRQQRVLPPLRERRSELLRLVHTLAQAEGASLRIGTDAAEALLCWSFPHNVRELRALVRAFLATRKGQHELDLAYLTASHKQLARHTLERRHAPAHPSSAPTRPLTPRLGGRGNG